MVDHEVGGHEQVVAKITGEDVSLENFAIGMAVYSIGGRRIGIENTIEFKNKSGFIKKWNRKA